MSSHTPRRQFLQSTTAAIAAAPLLAGGATAAEGSTTQKRIPLAESVVGELYKSLTPKQRKQVCFDWDHVDAKRGLLRKFISNNWRITRPAVLSDFYTAAQQASIRKIFEGLVNPEWVGRFDKQFIDDMGGFGRRQSIAIFGKPGEDKFEFVLSGRHGTMRCDGNSAEHVCFGGPIVYGHAAENYYEKANHAGNVFWHQAVHANKLYQMLDEKQRTVALLKTAPDEASIAFATKDTEPAGVAVADMTPDQQQHLQQLLQLLIEPYRVSDQNEALAALKAQGGLKKCRLTFYSDDDLGGDGVWDNWRLEGPSFVWHYRGAPHVHVWVHVASSNQVQLNAKNLSGPLRKKG